MGAPCDYYKDQVLTDFINNRAVAIGLLTTLPAHNGSGASPADGIEVANANGYARFALTAANWTKGLQGSTQQATYSAVITLPTITGAGYGPIAGWCIFDNVTYGAGHQIHFGEILPTPTYVAGAGPSFPANTIVVSFG